LGIDLELKSNALAIVLLILDSASPFGTQILTQVNPAASAKALISLDLSPIPRAM
jgi:hypothetical protein